MGERNEYRGCMGGPIVKYIWLGMVNLTFGGENLEKKPPEKWLTVHFKRLTLDSRVSAGAGRKEKEGNGEEKEEVKN